MQRSRRLRRLLWENMLNYFEICKENRHMCIHLYEFTENKREMRNTKGKSL